MPLIAWLASAFTTLFSSFKAWVLLLIGSYSIPWIINLLKGIGVGFVTYQIGTYALGNLFTLIKDSLGGLPSDLLMFIALARVDEAISILFAAFAARLAIHGFSGGSKKAVTLS